MTTEEIEQVKTLVLRDLPRVLEQDPGFVVFIEGILSEKFPRRDEFALLLEKVDGFREETGRSFKRVDQQFAGVDQQFAGVNQQFAGVNQQFAKVEQRFEKIDQKFAKVDEQFEKVDQRFEKVEQRLDRIDQQFSEVRQEIRGLRDWMELNVGGFQTRAGRRLEVVVAGAFCYGLQRADISPDHVKLRQVIEDLQGVVFRPGKKREVDIIALGNEIIVFEVKSTADHDDIDDLADKVALVRHLHAGKQVEGVLVMLGAETEHRRLCREKGLRLIP